MLYLPPDPKPGQPIRADTITAILKYLRQITPRSSASCDVQVGAGGTTHRPKFPRQPAPSIPISSAAAFPFQITTRADPDNPGQWQAMRNPDSTVMQSGQPNNNLAITGLGTWFPFIANDVIALYIAVTNLVAQSATIQSYGMGTTGFDPTLDAWDSSQESFVIDDGTSEPTGPNQVGLSILLGYSTPDDQGNPYFVQTQRNHVLLENSAILGSGKVEAAIYDWSHRERYGITYPGAGGVDL